MNEEKIEARRAFFDNADRKSGALAFLQAAPSVSLESYYDISGMRCDDCDYNCPANCDDME